ncbi:MAG: BA14K family protein, partial [Mesorhizobium sp.]
MNKIMSGLLAAALSVSFAATIAVPADAAQVFLPQAPSVSTDVQTVDHNPWGKRHNRKNRRFSRHDGDGRDGTRDSRDGRSSGSRHG